MTTNTEPDGSLSLAVRELAAFACQHGDRESAPAGPTAEQGRQAHQRLQQAEPELRSELSMSRTVTVDGLEVTLSGRLDLVDEDEPRLIEIKSTLVPVARLGEGRLALDRAQIALYAWLWLGQSERAAPSLELRYINLRDGSIESARVDISVEHIEQNAMLALRCRVAFEKALRRRRNLLMETAAQLEFPFGGLRSGQRTLAVSTYRAIRDGQSLVAQAPTGSGKTLGALFPSIKALGEGHVARVVWLTAKRSGKAAACEALQNLRSEGLQADALVLRSRRDSCPCDQRRFAAEELWASGDEDAPCERLVGYHDRLRVARQHLFDSEPSVVDAERLDSLAEQFRLCPHALALDLLPWVPLVIADYNHCLDPLAAVSSLQESPQRQVVLIDEAHNLPDRSRSMYSVQLRRTQCLEAARALEPLWPALSRALRSTARALSAAAKAHDLSAEFELLDEFPATVVRALKRTEDALADPPPLKQAASGGVAMPAAASALMLDIHRALLMEATWLNAHRCLMRRGGTGRSPDVELRVVCLDASEAVGQRLRGARSSISLSATLTPMQHYRQALGLPDGTPCLDVPSPFRQAQWHCQLIDWISVRFADRERSMATLVDAIARVVSAKAGHYLVFLPSFAYLEAVSTAFAAAHANHEIWTQPRVPDPQVMETLLGRLDADGHTVGFVITGGALGEGIDYRGDRLIGAIIVGVALSPRDIESDLAVAHHDSKGQNGYDICYRIPGVTRVLQSAGRVVRTERDRGVVVLIDTRFDEAFYRAVLPPVWSVQKPATPVALSESLLSFWSTPAEAGH